jgi:gliding-associated putative ABC transporter substrate-binding component GldG
LQDLNCAKQPLVIGNNGNQPQIERIPFPYYPLVAAPPNKQHAIAKNLDQILTVFPSSIDTVQAKGIKKTILLSSDSNSRSLSTPAIVSLQSIKSQEDLQQFNKSFVPIGVLLEGNFSSLYANRFTPAMQDSITKLTGVPFMAKAIKPSQQMVFSDADIITNVITESNQTLAMGTQKFENYQFANRDFFLNCMDYLVGNAAIIETRNKDFNLRLLNKQLVKDQKAMWQFINILMPLVLVLLIGFAVSWYRKKQFG